MKTFFELKAPYEGLRVRRLKESGRIWLVQVINDPPPYWLVRIRSFDPRLGGRDRVLVDAGLAHPLKIGSWRFQSLEPAQAKFDQLCALPLYQAEEQRAKKVALERSQRARALNDSGKMVPIRPNAVKISTGDQEKAFGGAADPQIQPPAPCG